MFMKKVPSDAKKKSIRTQEQTEGDEYNEGKITRRAQARSL